MHQSHTSTQQWQSFELRMRQRRVQRCMLRASEALNAHSLVEARAAVEEAQQLVPDSREVSELAARVAVAAATPPPRARSARRYHVASAALLLLAAGAGSVWIGSTAMRTVPQQAALTGRSAVPPEPLAVGRPGTTASVPAAPVLDETAPGPEPPETESSLAAADNALPAAEIPASEGAAGEPGAGEVATREAAAREAAARETAAREAAARQAAAAAVPASGPSSREAPTAIAVDQPTSVRTVASAETGAATSGAVSAPPARSDPPVSPAAPPVRSTAVENTPAPAPAAALVAELPAPAPLDLTRAAVPRPEPLRSPVAATTAPATAPAVAPERRVRAALNRYEAAYSQLDAAAAGAVWPSVDRRALERAFDGLASQSVTLGRCDVNVNGGAATAECTGQARWTPKVGGGTQTASRQWRFELTHAGEAWVITQATVR